MRSSDPFDPRAVLGAVKARLLSLLARIVLPSIAICCAPPLCCRPNEPSTSARACASMTRNVSVSVA